MKEEAGGVGSGLVGFHMKGVCRFHLLSLGIERDNSSIVSKAMKH